MTIEQELAQRLAGHAVVIVSCFRFRESLGSDGRVYFPAHYAVELAAHCPVAWINPPGRRPRLPRRHRGVLAVDLVGRPRDPGFFGVLDWVQARALLRLWGRRHRTRERLVITFSSVLPSLQPPGPARRIAFVGDDFVPLDHPYLAACDLVVCSSELHAERVRARPGLPAALQLSMGVTERFLELAGRATPSGVLRRLFERPERPLAAYFGTLRRADVDLLAHAAALRPEVNFACAGTLGDELDPGWRERLALPNVRFLPRYRNEEMPNLLAEVDAGLIAYAVDEFNVGCSPTKLYEYFALGLPVVSTPLGYPTDVAPLVAVAGSPEELVRALDAALAGDGERSARLEVARCSTPKHRLLAVLRALEA